MDTTIDGGTGRNQEQTLPQWGARVRRGFDIGEGVSSGMQGLRLKNRAAFLGVLGLSRRMPTV